VERVLFAPREPAPLFPDVQQDSVPYTAWVRRREAERLHSVPARGTAAGVPVLSLVMVVADVDPEGVRRTLESLRLQTSEAWSLTMVAVDHELGALTALARSSTPRHSRERVRTLGAPESASERALLGVGVQANRSAPLALIFPGDVWAPDAVHLLTQALTPTGVVYADEDVMRTDGTHAAPRLKPDFSPDFLLSSAYVGRPLAVGSSLAAELCGLVATGSAELEHDCALRACEAAETVVHIPEVLCHRSAAPHAPVGPVSLRHVQEALRRRGEGDAVASGPVAGTHRLFPPAKTGTPVSILIPFRDEPRLLRTCVDSISSTTGGIHASVELVLIDNGSTDPETLTLVERLAAYPDVRVVSDPRPFNWAALNNGGARQARGEVLLFLNNDVEAHRSGWLAALCAQAVRPDVGAVGARLLYPDGRLQHCGLVVGLTGAAGHVLGGLSRDAPGYLGMATSRRECSAVTGACLATRREVFDLLGGFDEALGVDLNDVDYCLRAAAKGYRTLYEPEAELIHHESPSRGTAGGVGDIVNFLDRWREYIDAGDRYLNAHLTRADPSCGLARPDEQDAWNQWYATLTMQ
jgi:O-antigen biosynthesis protein